MKDAFFEDNVWRMLFLKDNVWRMLSMKDNVWRMLFLKDNVWRMLFMKDNKFYLGCSPLKAGHIWLTPTNDDADNHCMTKYRK